MAFFKRKKEGTLPDLPPLPEPKESLPPIPESKELTKETSLPSLPHTKEERIDHDIVKQIIKEEKPEVVIPETPKKPLVKEIGSETISMPQQPKEVEKEVIEQHETITHYDEQTPLKEQSTVPTTSLEGNVTSIKPREVFVKIEDYKNAIEKLQEVKSRVMEIEKLLSDIKEIKAKEEVELDEWEKEIKNIKSKLDKIDKILFSEI